MISEDDLAEKQKTDAVSTEPAAGEDHAIAIEPAGASNVAKVPPSRHWPTCTTSDAETRRGHL